MQNLYIHWDGRHKPGKVYRCVMVRVFRFAPRSLICNLPK